MKSFFFILVALIYLILLLPFLLLGFIWSHIFHGFRVGMVLEEETIDWVDDKLNSLKK